VSRGSGFQIRNACLPFNTVSDGMQFIAYNFFSSPGIVLHVQNIHCHPPLRVGMCMGVAG